MIQLYLIKIRYHELEINPLISPDACELSENRFSFDFN